MTNKQELFDERYRKVLKRHRQLSRGYVTRLGANGIIDHHPIGQIRNPISLKALMMPFALLFFLKACIVTILGNEAYAAQIALLNEGGLGAQIAGFLMKMDPITWVLSQFLGSIIG